MLLCETYFGHEICALTFHTGKVRALSSGDSPPTNSFPAECGRRIMGRAWVSLTTRLMSHLHQGFAWSSNKKASFWRKRQYCWKLLSKVLPPASMPHWYRLKTFLYPLKPLQMSAMACLLLLLAAVLMEHADGRPALPPLPVKGDHVWQALKSRPGRPRVNSNKSSVFLPTDGCFVASSEVELFRVEGEAVILSFPMFSRVLQVRKIAPSSAKYTISKGNGSESAADEDKERVQQSNKQLWFLPVKASDSGEYTCTYRCALKPPWALL